MIAKRLWQTNIDGTFLGTWLSITDERICFLVRRDRAPVLTGINNLGGVAWDREFEFDSVRAFRQWGRFLYLDGTTIRKVDCSNGAIVAEHELSLRVQIMPSSRLGPVFSNREEIFAVKPDTLETMWNWRDQKGAFIVTGADLVSYEENGEITIVNVADGVKKVRKLCGPTKEELGLGVHLLDDLLVQIYWGARFAVNLTTGGMTWRREDDRHGTHERIVFDGATGYSAWHDLKAIDLRTGEVSWQSELSHRIETPPHVASGKVYVGTKDGGVHAVDAQTGQVLWSFNVDYDPVAVQPRSRGEVVVLGWEVISCYKIEED